MRGLVRSSSTLILSSALAVFGAACGDDDGDGSAADAAPQIDAAGDPDAEVAPVLMRSGTLAITELAVDGLAVSGALNSISFVDETSRTVAPLTGFESPVGGCQIFVYDVGTDEEPDPVDAGAVSVTGISSNGDFACAFVDADIGYVCQSTDAAIAGGVAGNADGYVTAANQLTMNDDAGSPLMTGMHMRLSGWPIEDGDYPVVGHTQAGGSDLIALPGVGADTADADSTYTTFVGEGPVPGGFNYLDDGTEDVTIAKAAGGGVAAINLTGKTVGDGFTLHDAEGYVTPGTLPTDGTAALFGCDADADGCGVLADDQDDFLLTAMTISGSTTDAALGDSGPTDMPDPVTQYATFTCSTLGIEDTGINEVSIPAAAMAAILDTNPTRIRTSVTHSTGSIEVSDDETSTVNVVLGHGVLGFTDVPQE